MEKPRDKQRRGDPKDRATARVLAGCDEGSKEAKRVLFDNPVVLFQLQDTFLPST